MKVFAVTCTGERPELFALCRKWVERQTVQPDHWLVVTDNGEVIDNLPDWAHHEHVDRLDGAATVIPDNIPNYSLHQALLRVPRDCAAVVFEDDDWYRKDHIEVSMRKLAEGHLVAYGSYVVRFHVPQQQWWAHRKPGASEGRVTLHPDAVVEYANRMMGRDLWAGPTDGRYKQLTTVGIKGVGYGLPGRPGATPIHHSIGYWKDPLHARMRATLGEDAEDYISLLQ